MNSEAVQNITENVPSRETSSMTPAEIPQESPNAGNVIKPCFRDSSKLPRRLPPRKLPNAERRSREFLTPEEAAKLQSAAEKVGRNGHRDGTMILLAYRHGFRVSELISLRKDQIDLKQGLLHVRRRKNGNPSTHPLSGIELRALRNGIGILVSHSGVRRIRLGHRNSFQT